MRLNVCFDEMVPFRLFAAFVKAVPVMAEVVVSPQEEMANPQGMKVFALVRRSLPEDFVCFAALCGV